MLPSLKSHPFGRCVLTNPTYQETSSFPSLGLGTVGGITLVLPPLPVLGGRSRKPLTQDYLDLFKAEADLNDLWGCRSKKMRQSLIFRCHRQSENSSRSAATG